MDAFEKSLNDIIESLSRQVNQGSDGGNNIRHIMAGVTLALRTYRAYKTETEINVYDKVETEPIRHGRWIKMRYRVYQCSCCKRAVFLEGLNVTDENETKLLRELFPYCHCGAKMDGKEK